jgi:DNA helicase-2/ATP-dependent DNA helicase PcrA
VLARTNARLTPVAAALRRAGIPFRQATTRRHDCAVDAALRALRAAERRAPLRAAMVDALADAADGLDPAGPTDEEPAQAGAVAELLTRLADEYAAEEPGPTVGGFLGWLAANPGAAELPSARQDAVELATFHRAKGLEWPAVAVIGLEDGMVPIAYAVDAAARAEERRLFYVALTRAERDVWCSWAARTGEGERSRERRPSPFLDAVRAAAADAEPPAPEVALSRIAALRARLPVAG